MERGIACALRHALSFFDPVKDDVVEQATDHAHVLVNLLLGDIFFGIEGGCSGLGRFLGICCLT